MELQLTDNITLFSNADNQSINRVYLAYRIDPRTVTDSEIAEAQQVAEQALSVKFHGFVRPFCNNRQMVAYWQ